MEFLEKNLEDILYENMKTNYGRSELFKRGLDCIEPNREMFNVKRQVSIGNYGAADLITFNKWLINPADKKVYEKATLSIYELKKDTINIKTLLQITRYLKGIKRYLEKRKNFKTKFQTNIIMIGKDIDVSSDWVYLFDIYKLPINIYTYEITLKGLRFNNIYLDDYDLTNDGFNYKL